MNQDLKDYRALLIAAEKQAQEQYDKTILTLSGGAFGISFAFVDKVAGADPILTGWLLGAWLLWGLSITSILFSFFFSNMALRKTIEQVDEETLYDETPGGHYTKVTSTLNVFGGAFFFLGAVTLVVFVYHNI